MALPTTSPLRATISLIILSLLAGTLTLVILGRDAGRLSVTGDSFVYVNVAQSLVDGDGFRDQARFWNMTASDRPPVWGHYPPAYATFLALIDRAGGDIRGHVMVTVNAILLALAAAFTGGITFTLTRRVSWTGLAALFALAYVYSLYYMQWSETLYLVFQMPAVFALIAYFDSRRIQWLVVAGVFMSLTWLTRYAGAGIVLPAIGLVLIANHPTWKDRLIATTLFATVSGLGMAIWYGYIFTTSDTVIFNHVQTNEKLATNWDWFYLHLKRITGSREALFGVLVILVVSLLWTVLSARKHTARRTWTDYIRAGQDALTSGPGVLLSLSAVYTAMIFVSATTSNVTMDLRMIVLAFPLLTAATITLLSRENAWATFCWGVAPNPRQF